MRVKLGPLLEEHASQLAKLANNKNIADALMDYFPHPYELKHAYEFVVTTAEKEPRHTFGIFYKKQLVGIIGFNVQSDIYRVSAELGYWVAEEFWRKGIATAAIREMTRYGFKTLDLQRIYARVFEFNSPSMRTLEKNGYCREGILKRAAIKNGLLQDIHLYAITK
jgi:ribosomal-protein-alanine N-acetyltransferase